MKYRSEFWVLVAVVLMLASCGGGTRATTAGGGPPEMDDREAPTTVVSKRGSDSVMATFGSPGGSLELSNGARIEIPDGAIEGAQDVVFKNAPPTTAFKDVDVQGDKPVGPIVLVTPELSAPEGKSFRISIPFSSVPEGYDASNLYLAYETPANLQRNFAEDTTVTRWEYQDAVVRGGRAEAELGYLPGMRFQFILSREE